MAIPLPVFPIGAQSVAGGRRESNADLLASSHAKPEDRASPTSDSGIRTVDVLFMRGEHWDAGDPNGRAP